MTEVAEKHVRNQKRFKAIFPDGEKFEKKLALSSHVSCDEEKEFLSQAFDARLDGTQTKELEKELAKYMGIQYAVALSSGAAAMHLALKLAAEKLYGSSTGISTPSGLGKGGALLGKRVFCSDLISMDMVSPIVCEGGEPVFIDSSGEDYSMDPEVLELAFEKYPDVNIVVMNHAYGFPGQIVKIRQICFKHDALLIECADDSLGASYWVGQGEPGAEGGVWAKTGALGDYAVLDFGKGKIASGSSGGSILTRDFYASEKASYWAGGARADAPWRQHEELGYGYLMGDLDAAVIRAQLIHIEEQIARKKEIYERYQKKLDQGLAYMVPVAEGTKPNYYLSCMTSESSIQFQETRDDRRYTYTDQHGTAAPMELYDALTAFHAGCSPIYKPMSMQPVFRNNEHFTLDGSWRSYADFYNDSFWLRSDRARQYFETGICLPSDVGMTAEEQERVIEIVYACYDMAGLERGVWAVG